MMLRTLSSLVVASLLTLIVAELALHLVIRPSANAYGELLGIDLPPLRGRWDKPPIPGDRSKVWEHLIVDGRPITIDDLWGIMREDPDLGYVPQENARSLNGWWQSNNVGARDRRDIMKARPPNQQRLLVFGDSFGVSSRNKQEDMWSARLETLSGFQVVNFAVDGYSMAQSFLRYGEIKDRLDHDVDLLMFVPSADLRRDITGFAPSEGPMAVPRFVITQGALRLIPRPYPDQASLFADNRGAISERLRSFLKYDRFYFAPEFEQDSVLQYSIIYKLCVTAYYQTRTRYLLNHLKDQASEALQVSSAIFRAMNEDAGRNGRRFVLVFLPMESDLPRLKTDRRYHEQWQAMVSAACSLGMVCVDLSDNLAALSDSDLDRGFDGTHYGTRTNRFIGETIARGLRNNGVFAESVVTAPARRQFAGHLDQTQHADRLADPDRLVSRRQGSGRPE